MSHTWFQCCRDQQSNNGTYQICNYDIRQSYSSHLSIRFWINWGCTWIKKITRLFTQKLLPKIVVVKLSNRRTFDKAKPSVWWRRKVRVFDDSENSPRPKIIDDFSTNFGWGGFSGLSKTRTFSSQPKRRICLVKSLSIQQLFDDLFHQSFCVYRYMERTLPLVFLLYF